MSGASNLSLGGIVLRGKYLGECLGIGPDPGSDVEVIRIDKVKVASALSPQTFKTLLTI